MYPFWPVIIVLSICYHFISPLLSGPYMEVDAFSFDSLQAEVWLSRALGYQFLIPRLRARIARNVEDCLRKASAAGVKVLGLGALNKAEFINAGGDHTLRNVPHTSTRLVHGNTLTAAVVIENILTVLRQEYAHSVTVGQDQAYQPQVFLTGATSKVGTVPAVVVSAADYATVATTVP